MDIDRIRLSTTVAIPQWEGSKLSTGEVIAAVGSCFAEEIIGSLITSGVFTGAQNPAGIAYNPISIASAVTRAVSGCEYVAEDFFHYDGLWHSWNHHGSFSHPSLDIAIESANRAQSAFSATLSSASMTLLTYSSTVVHVLANESSKVVSNCHKMPNNTFNRRILSVGEAQAAVTKTLDAIRSFNPTTVIVLTLSPIRHYPGDLVLNGISKAIMRAAMHQSLESRANFRYFPAYEMVMDELRDYRFYSDDLLHLSTTAKEIIKKRFLSWCCEPRVAADLAQFQAKQRAAGHRSLHNRTRIDTQTTNTNQRV